VDLFDLFFMLLVPIAFATFLAAAWSALRREFSRARRILFRLFLGTATYMAIVVAVSLILPRRVIHAGDSQCFDDWCIAIAGYKRSPEGARIRYNLNLRLSSRARRVSQRENNVAFYLTDSRGRRYDAMARGSSGAFNALLQPQESIIVSRSFLVPAEASEVGAVITHEGGFPIGWFIIGYDTWFRKPALAALQ
jgi:hypothetical protein